MGKKRLEALTGRDIRRGKYILIRIIDSDQLLVNVMEIVSEPVFEPEKGVKTFQARGLFEGLEPIPEDEGGSMELDLNDIGAPWKGSRVGFKCRTFRYGEVEHMMLVHHVRENAEFWSEMFTKERCIINYSVSSPEANQFSLGSTGDTILSRYIFR